MNYSMEELAEVVAVLAQEYEYKKRTPISYEKAEQLMEAVLFCVKEFEKNQEQKECFESNEYTVKDAYQLGYQLVVDKVEATWKKYDQLMKVFDDYENRCLYDTVVKGIPSFIQWYDPRFFPQNSCLRLEYPIREDLSPFSGIDRMDAYLDYILKEQEELKHWNRQQLLDMLKNNNGDYPKRMDNLLELIQGIDSL